MVRSKKTIVFAIPSYNEADSIGSLTKVIDKGLTKYFPEYKSIILNADNDSPDGTEQAFLCTPTKSKKVYLTSRGKPKQIRGKGFHMKMALEFAQKNKAAALGFIDGDVVSATPEWVKLLLEPVLKKRRDHVLPIYLRNKFDGSITNHLVYPALYGLLGINIRQPLAGEIGLSPRAIQTFLGKRWAKPMCQFGVDIFFVTESVFHDLKIGQIFLGIKDHKPSAPKLDNMFLEVAESLFLQLKSHQTKPKQHFIPILNKPRIHLRYPKMDLDHKKLKEKIKGGALEIHSEAWLKIIYEFLNSKNVSRKELLDFRAAFFMRFLTFYNEVRGKSHQESEKEIVKQAKLYKRLHYLAV